MIKNILNLSGVQEIKKNAQKSIKGGDEYIYYGYAICRCTANNTPILTGNCIPACASQELPQGQGPSSRD